MHTWRLLPLVVLAVAGPVWMACSSDDAAAPGGVVSLDAGPEDDDDAASATSEAGPASDDTTPLEPKPYEKDAGAVPPSAATCASYCDGYGTVCGFAAAEDKATDRYLSKAACMAACALTPAGVPTIIDGNTLACRAGTYGGSGETPCAAGGPFGLYGITASDAGPDADVPPSRFGEVACGKTACDTFCALATSACADAGASSPSWNGGFDKGACLATCGVDFAFDLDAGAASVDDGRNTLNCRMYQLQLALTDPSRCAMLGVGSDGGTCTQ